MSTSWKTPGCVHGSETIRTSGWLGERFMRIRRNWIVEGVMKRDVHESMYDERAVMIRKDDLARLNPNNGYSASRIKPKAQNKMMHVKGSARYSENIFATILLTIRVLGEVFHRIA
jgi:hypothetical protein